METAVVTPLVCSTWQWKRKERTEAVVKEMEK